MQATHSIESMWSSCKGRFASVVIWWDTKALEFALTALNWEDDPYSHAGGVQWQPLLIRSGPPDRDSRVIRSFDRGTMSKYLVVLLGGGIGAVARFIVGTIVARSYSTTFPLGTFVINISGSFLIGL